MAKMIETYKKLNKGGGYASQNPMGADSNPEFDAPYDKAVSAENMESDPGRGNVLGVDYLGATPAKKYPGEFGFSGVRRMK